MKQINFELSDKLYSKLLEIRNKLSVDEKIDVEFSDMIEESLMFYYNIKITDINNNDDLINAEFINRINYINNKKRDYYVYVYVDLSKKCNKSINNYYFEFEPFYVGKGCNNRMLSVNDRDAKLKKYIEKLKNDNLFRIEKVISDVTEEDAFSYEQIFINNFGRLNNGTGILYNKTDGNTKIKKIINEDNFIMNLEYSYINSLLITLNNERTIKDASLKLNVSERTIFRKIKEYSLTKDSETKKWYISKITS